MVKPKIAILHYATPPTIGGVESTMAAHARLFADREYAVAIITGAGEAFDPRIPVEVIPEAGTRSPEALAVNKELAQGHVTSRFEALVQRLCRELEGALADTDILIAHNVLSLHKNLALTDALWRLRERRKLRLVAWCHDMAWSDPQYAADLHEGLPWGYLRQPWEQVRYVVVSEARKHELAVLWGNNGKGTEISVVPAGIDPIQFLGLTEEAAGWTRDLHLLEAEPLLLLPARLTRRKNVEFAIEITAALRRQGKKAKLVVTGPPGPHNPSNAAYLESLRALRKERGMEDSVVFLHERGEVQGPSMRDLYWVADALLFPSEREGFGIPVLEAGLVRLPVFCSDLPPLRESARGQAHYLALDETPEKAAALVADALSRDRAYCLKRRVVNEYSWERIFVERIEPVVVGGNANAG
ncbi:MAG: glycosyltransferase family 4 protein [Chloroflexi bacterium]|nr:glycosyltransferase family 4 protein [Chloroflexota bacterium]